MGTSNKGRRDSVSRRGSQFPSRRAEPDREEARGIKEVDPVILKLPRLTLGIAMLGKGLGHEARDTNTLFFHVKGGIPYART
jgi:hypothetical protein